MVVLEKNVILTKADHTGEQSLTHLMHMQRGSVDHAHVLLPDVET